MYGYNLDVPKRVNDDLMKAVYNAPKFPLLDHLATSDKLISEKEILDQPVDTGKNYESFSTQEVISIIESRLLGILVYFAFLEAKVGEVKENMVESSSWHSCYG